VIRFLEQPSFRWNDAFGLGFAERCSPSLGGGSRPHDLLRKSFPREDSLPRILLERPHRDSLRSMRARSSAMDASFPDAASNI